MIQYEQVATEETSKDSFVYEGTYHELNCMTEDIKLDFDQTIHHQLHQQD